MAFRALETQCHRGAAWALCDACCLPLVPDQAEIAFAVTFASLLNIPTVSFFRIDCEIASDVTPLHFLNNG